MAAQKGQYNVVQMLIKAGCNIDAPCPYGSTGRILLFLTSKSNTRPFLVFNAE